ncbi:MAG: glycoside hydrolase family 3 protein [Chloroflexi bacterium]|nr:glycoside hydrolase family 3 protein [Chloroflexota bacterium]
MRLSVVPVIALLAAIVLPGAGATQATERPWLDTSRPIEERASALIAEMTLDERIGQMTQLEMGSVDSAGVASLHLGSVLSGGGGAPTRNDVTDWREMVAAYQDAALSTRLAIPMLYGVDAIHGHNNVRGATIFPHAIGLGAAGDPALVERVARATAEEMVATGIRWDFAPVVAVPQDVRWGRTYEAFGEDPTLVSELGAAAIQGLQGTDLADPTAVLATPKHFLGDGGTAFGSATTGDYLLDQGVTDVDEVTLRAIHLPPYEAALAAGARIVMASFSSTRDGKVHADHRLLTDLLKGELGFTGFVVSDWAGVDQVHPDFDTAVAMAISAGIDMVMVPYDGQRFQDAVRAGLTTGTITQDRIEDAVRRILRVKLEMGLFEHPMPPATDPSVVGSAVHRALAREAVARSAVLLATDGSLPIDPDDTVLLVGSGASDIGAQSGGWTITWQGGRGAITPGTTIADALRDRIGGRLLAVGPAAGAEGLLADVGVVVLAEEPYAEGVGDSATLAIRTGGFLDQLRPKVDRLVVVLLSGRPVLLDEVLASADVVIAAWLPGTEGAGVVDVLVGEAPFGGTTPFTWPRTPDDARRTGKAPCDGARFPRGYGLTTDGTPLGPAACP